MENFRVVDSGPRKIANDEYTIQDIATKRVIDLSKSWEACLMPGQKLDMTMLFVRPDRHCSSCPSCKTVCESIADEAVECRACGLHFQRIIQAEEPFPLDATRKRSSVQSPPHVAGTLAATGKRNFVDDDYEEEVRQYRRIKVIGKRATTNERRRGLQPTASCYWSVSDQESFLSLVKVFGTDWQQIASRLGNKTPLMVYK